MCKHFGRQSIRFENTVYIISTASTVGKREGEGPLGKYFDVVLPDSLCGENSWEKAESKIVKDTFSRVLAKSNLSQKNIDYTIRW